MAIKTKDISYRATKLVEQYDQRRKTLSGLEDIVDRMVDNEIKFQTQVAILNYYKNFYDPT